MLTWSVSLTTLGAQDCCWPCLTDGETEPRGTMLTLPLLF